MKDAAPRRGEKSAKRLTLVFPERTYDRIERLRDLTDASSSTEVIRNALMVYEVIANAAQSGSTLLQRSANGQYQILPISVDVEVAPNSPNPITDISTDLSDSTAEDAPLSATG